MKKIKKKVPRNTSALAAKSRKSANAPMKHRLEPKAGAKNEQKEIIEDFEEELDDDCDF